MSKKSIYYKVSEGSEAHKIIKEIQDEISEYEKWKRDLPKRLVCDENGDQMLCYSDGSPAGFYFKSKPEGWKRVKGYYSYYYPHAKNKPAMTILKEKKPKSRNIDLSELLFGRTPMTMMPNPVGYGFLMRSGASFCTLSGTVYVSVCDDGKKTSPIVKGLRKIKYSTYVKAKEDSK